MNAWKHATSSQEEQRKKKRSRRARSSAPINPQIPGETRSDRNSLTQPRRQSLKTINQNSAQQSGNKQLGEFLEKLPTFNAKISAIQFKTQSPCARELISCLPRCKIHSTHHSKRNKRANFEVQCACTCELHFLFFTRYWDEGRIPIRPSFVSDFCRQHDHCCLEVSLSFLYRLFACFGWSICKTKGQRRNAPKFSIERIALTPKPLLNFLICR